MQFCFIKLLLHLDPSKTKYASQKISTITKITNRKGKNNLAQLTNFTQNEQPSPFKKIYQNNFVFESLAFRP